jgi:hypothetical protein
MAAGPAAAPGAAAVAAASAAAAAAAAKVELESMPVSAVAMAGMSASVARGWGKATLLGRAGN